MALKITDVVSPDPVRNVEASSSSGSENLAAFRKNIIEARPVVPTKLYLDASSQKNLKTFIGRELAVKVLWVTAGTIAALILYLSIMEFYLSIVECFVFHDFRASYREASPASNAAPYGIVDRLQRLSDNLEMSRNNPSIQWDRNSESNAQDTIDQLSFLADEQRSELGRCIPPPQANDPNRDGKIETCLVILSISKQNALQAIHSATESKPAPDWADKMSERRENLHKFWIQAAQLVLLNLLLPLLTALFGYIFGSQQEKERAQEER